MRIGGVSRTASSLTGGADVGELLALEHVDLKVVVAGVLADDHAAINLPARLDHHRAAVFELEHGVGDRLAHFVGDQHAVAAAGDVALVRRIGVEQPVHDRGAAGVGQKLALVADQAAGRRVEHQPDPVAAGGLHLDHLGLALRHLLHDDAGMDLVDVDHDLFDRLFQLARCRSRRSSTLGRDTDSSKPSRRIGLDQDAELQFAAAGDLHRILVVGFADAQRDVALGLAQQPVADHAAGDLAAFGAGERRIVDAERHGQRRRVDRLGVDRRLDRRIADGVGDGRLRQAGDARRCRRPRPLRPERARGRGTPAPW